MRFTVYDPAGEMFEVPASKAKDLIVNHGWAVTPPVAQAEQPSLFTEETAKTPSRRSRRS